jgi:RTA1 like protein
MEDTLESRFSRTRSLLLAGNVINLLTLIVFTIYAVLSHIRSPGAAGLKRLYTCLGLLFIRTIYRVIAYSRGLIDPYNQNANTFPLRETPLFHDGFMYGFDALLIFLVLAVLAAWYPTRHSLEEGESSSFRSVGLGTVFGKTSPSGRGSSMRMEGVSRA